MLLPADYPTSLFAVSCLLCLFTVYQVYVFIWSQSHQKGLQLFPRVGKDPSIVGTTAARRDFLLNGHALISQGYSQFKGSIFRIQTADMERLVISNQYLEELRNLPESQLSLRRAMSERHLGQYTTLDTILESHLQNNVCRVQLTQHLGKLIPAMLEELEHGLQKDLTVASNAWSSYPAGSVVLPLVSRMLSRVLIGLPTCRNPEWLETSIGYTKDVFRLAGDLRQLNPLLRPFVYPFLSSRRDLKGHLRVAEKYIFGASRDSSNKDVCEGSLTLLHWMMEAAEGPEKSHQSLLRKAMFLCMASIHTTSSTIIHTLFDICAMPELADILRHEISASIKKAEGLNLSALYDMTLLDSFLRESQRLNHPGTLSFNRKVVQDIMLSDGAILPAGTFIGMPAAAIARDPEFYQDADKFIPSRFSDLRTASPAEINRHQFVSTEKSYLAFGYGRFSCPGRFFAAAQIKLLLAKLLIDYDISFPEGQITRPDNLFIDERIIPDPKQSIRLRRSK